MTTTPGNSNYETRQQALEQAVRWTTGAGRDEGHGGFADARKAAEEFDAFLAGAPVAREPKTLAELCDDIQWDDAQWRSDFLRAILESVTGRLRAPGIIKAIGNLTEISDLDAYGRARRAGVKGVQDLEITSINRSDEPTSSSAPVAIDRIWKFDAKIYEIAPRLTPEFKTRVHEDELRSKTAVQLEEFVMALVVDARNTLDDWILGAVRALLQSVGHDLDLGHPAFEFLDPDFSAVVVPFRFEFVRFDGWRGKEWMEEGGEYWNLWIKGKFGAAVFKPHTEIIVGDQRMKIETITPNPKQRLADEVLKRAGTDVPGQVQVSGAEAAALIDAGVADPASIEVVTPDPAGQIAQPGADDPRA